MVQANPLVVASAVGLGGLLSWYIYQRLRRRSSQKPLGEEQWQLIGSLKEIDLFPVKSGGAVVTTEAVCDELSLRSRGVWDRCLVLLTDEDRVATGEVYPALLKIQVQIFGEALLLLRAPDMPPLAVDIGALQRSQRPVRQLQRKGFRLPLIEADAAQHVWCSQVVFKRDSGLRLCLALPPVPDTSWWRDIRPEWAPFMVMHSKSVDELNERLAPENRVHQQQFRGNLLIESADSVAAFDEDDWQWLRIGEDPATASILSCYEPCTRCIMPNIDIKTCERSAAFEPMRTLRTYRLRCHPRDPDMGVRFNVHRGGVLRQGDPVYVQYRSRD